MGVGTSVRSILGGGYSERPNPSRKGRGEGMRISVSKPRKGLTTVILDDRYGFSGKRVVQEGVPVADVAVVATGLASTWHQRRAAIKAAIRQENPGA